MRLPTIIAILLMLTSCVGQNKADLPPREIIEAETVVGVDSSELDYATQLEIFRDLPGPKLCAAALPLQSIAEMFVLNDDQTDISFFLGFTPGADDTDVVKLLTNELNRRFKSNKDKCIARNGANYRKATAICLEEAKQKDQFWYTKSLEIKDKCATQAKTQGLCEPLWFGGVLMGGSSSVIGDCGCTKKAIENVCGSEFASKANIRALINNNIVRKKREKAKQEADEKRRERQSFIQNYSRSLNSTLYCTARQGLPGTMSISCF